MKGELEVLSVGRGHLRLQITSGSKADRDKARKLIEDMLRQGYAIFVEAEPGQPLERVKSFDPKRFEYILDPAGGAAPARKAGVRRLSAAKSKATVVGRTAGG